MKPYKSRPILLTFLAFATGTSVGTLISYFISESKRMDECLGAIVLSPIVMTIGTLNAVQFLPRHYGILILIGIVLSVVSVILARIRKPLFPQYLLFLGSALWSLGNVTGLRIIMSV